PFGWIDALQAGRHGAGAPTPDDRGAPPRSASSLWRARLKYWVFAEDRRIPVFGQLVSVGCEVAANMRMYVCRRPSGRAIEWRPDTRARHSPADLLGIRREQPAARAWRSQSLGGQPPLQHRRDDAPVLAAGGGRLSCGGSGSMTARVLVTGDKGYIGSVLTGM